MDTKSKLTLFVHLMNILLPWFQSFQKFIKLSNLQIEFKIDCNFNSQLITILVLKIDYKSTNNLFIKFDCIQLSEGKENFLNQRNFVDLINYEYEITSNWELLQDC